MNIVLKALTASITSDQKHSSSSSSSSASLSTISNTASSIPTPTIISKDVKHRVGVSTRRSSSLHTNNNNDKNNSKDIMSKVSSNSNNNNSSHDEIIRMINQVNNDDKLQSQIMSLLKQEKKLTHIFNDYHPIHFNNSNNASCTSGSSNDSNYGSLSTNHAVTSSGVKRKLITDDKNISNNLFMNESKSDLTTTASTTGANTATATTMAASITNQRYHHNDTTTQQSYTNSILKMSNKENISHLFQNRNINNIISGNSRYDSGERKLKSSSSSSLSPLKTIPCNLKDQIINIKNKSILHSINDINNNNNKWIKPKIDDNDHDKQDMRSIIEKRMGALRKFLDVDQDNVTATDTLDITGFTGFF